MYISKYFGVFAFAAVATVNAQQLCNGFAEYCNKPYNSLTYILTHNSYGFAANPAANQLCPTDTQLTDGVRGLKLSAISANNSTTPGIASDSIQLCHTACSILNAGPAVNTLITIANWVKSNPNEVVTIMWNNLGNFSPKLSRQHTMQVVSWITFTYKATIITHGQRLVK